VAASTVVHMSIVGCLSRSDLDKRREEILLLFR
jgi:hypothetical protein